MRTSSCSPWRETRRSTSPPTLHLCLDHLAPATTRIITVLRSAPQDWRAGSHKAREGIVAGASLCWEGMFVGRWHFSTLSEEWARPDLPPLCADRELDGDADEPAATPCDPLPPPPDPRMPKPSTETLLNGQARRGGGGGGRGIPDWQTLVPCVRERESAWGATAGVAGSQEPLRFSSAPFCLYLDFECDLISQNVLIPWL